ncbi:YadA family autotransporter adhesin [Paraburkholderia franconis]|nr:YadA family autotransporter adhesin [Paraburkholderia franconis]
MRRRAQLMLACVVLTSAVANANAQALIGNGSVGVDTTGVALGDSAYSGGIDATAVGDTSTAGTDNATAIGAHSRAMAASATAVGHAAQAIAVGSLALGANSMATLSNSVALGAGSNATFSNSVALGAGSTTLFGAQSGYTAFGLDASQTSSGEVNVGNRTISGVAAGRVDQDAVNVAQLKAVASRIDGAVMYDRNPDGTISHDSVTLQGDPANGGTRIHNVANAVDAHDAVNLGQLSALLDSTVGNMTVNTSNPMFSSEGSPATEPALASGTHSIAAGANAQAGGANAVALGAGSNASADNSVALGQGSVADRANTVSVGAAGQERQITNVAAGVQGTDAVNVNQLNQSVSSAVGQAKSYTDDKVRSVRKDGYGGAAAAIAMAGLPQAVLPGHGMVALSAGTYGGQSAMAVGVSQLSDTGKWVYKLQGTASSRGEVGASVGAGMHW